MKTNGMIWTAVGAGIFAGGGIMTFNGIQNLTDEDPANFGSFAAGLGIMCFGAFPLAYGMVAWITGNEKVNRIAIELLAFNSGKIDLYLLFPGI